MARRFAPTESVEFYRRTFVEFCRYETAAGGPDPHMAVVGYLAKDEPLEERIWRIGCYLSVFNVPTAELLWSNWTREQVLADPAKLESWLRDNWKGLHLRRERRPVKAPHRLAEHLTSFASWAGDRFPVLLQATTYDEVWDLLNEIRYVGRYAAIKLGEAVHRYCEVTPAIGDMRPRGGKHPRIGLAYLYPKHAEQLNGNDSGANLELTNRLGEGVQKTLAEEHGLELDHFHVEALLCDYKQSYHGRQYPGRSQDSELGHYRKVKDYWGDRFVSRMFEARRALFPEWALGELQGWDGVRDELTPVLRDYGYTWSDSVYSYQKTTDFANPARRGEWASWS